MGIRNKSPLRHFNTGVVTMSYQESFDAALHACPSGELLSYGACVLASLANLENVLSRHVPGNHDAHVIDQQSQRTARMVARALANDCPPPVENDKALTVTAPAASGQGVGIQWGGLVRASKKSNLDLNGRLVKKGAVVSWHGYRFHVFKVRMGTCYPVFSPTERRFFDCESVQVVG
jgi:hypothetical protein